MNKPLLLSVLFASSLLAACGGGGGGGGITPQPIVSPPTKSYTSKLIFTGALAGRAIQSDLRRAQSASPMSAGVSVPVMVVSPLFAGMDTSVYGGDVQAVVSPQPASTPVVTFSQNNPNAILQTPAPGSTPQPLPTGVIAQATVFGANAPETQSAGTASATVGDPVNQTPTTAVYSYMSIALDCGPGPGGIAAGTSTPYTHHFGWQWNGSAWTPDDDVTTADVYLDGPSCVAQNSSEGGLTIHVPGGDTRLSTDNAFSAIAAAQWASAETSFAVTAAITLNADGSNNGIVIGKTRDGSHVFKMFPNALGSSDGYFGAIEVSGSGVDGF